MYVCVLSVCEAQGCKPGLPHRCCRCAAVLDHGFGDVAQRGYCQAKLLPYKNRIKPHIPPQFWKVRKLAVSKTSMRYNHGLRGRCMQMSSVGQSGPWPSWSPCIH